MGRREDLLDQVTDHVFEHGLIGLTLRPVAAAIGTSDRMLIYHFGSRDELVAAVVTRAEDRAVAAVDALPGAAGVHAGVNALWAAVQTDPLHRCTDIYVQAAATGLIGQERFATIVREANERWVRALRDYLVRCGASPESVGRVVRLVDSSLYGFHLDLSTDRPDDLAGGVDDLAAAAQAIADGWDLAALGHAEALHTDQ
ncbi:TetR/AcrR family transcriptional regulator [Pseudofrankia sp. BMG5.36]|uniref:TetR/AcrR family transcriptional regulator n=1 Tax=Pseudofrankia sp. BMG5.36 TaxID=1834512 RepID=UPI0008DB23E4|nr:TetR/AcrR family transcriptional regulator [Pseudofrankia sp. BMG5.36]OHV42948.1 TetR family transcriptional regulator [Pseudofrankia sp. BMG5.36]